jgi:hypothetical protein
VSTLRIDPGDHACPNKPDPGDEACEALERNDGDVEWSCPECKSVWDGRAVYGKVKGGFRYCIQWRRRHGSNDRWKRQETKRIRDLMDNG